MENKKPGNFREAALSHIPPDLIKAMQQKAEITPEDLQKLHDQVLLKGPAIHAAMPGAKAPLPSPGVPTANVPSAPAFLSYAIEGHVINVPLDSAGAAITLFYTLLAFVWGNDKKVAKILKQFDFKFFDANQNQIYPKKGKKNA
jgi:hypothetical protein